ncbi:MAG TPA: AI-2E family transporter [Acidimicrobiales bacterium]|nr:AI-2E family transporter [Acidimicrobiales bacterium]
MTEAIRRAGQVAWALTGMAVVLAILLYLGWVIRVVWPPLILAGAIVFLLNPIVTMLHRRGLPRVLGTAATYLGGVGLVVLVGFLLAPQVGDQWDELADDWPELREEVEDWVDDRAEQSAENDWPVQIPTWNELEDSLSDDHAPRDLDGDGDVTAAERAEQRRDELFDQIDSFREMGLRIFHVGLIFVLAPIIAFYLLIDLPHIRRVTESLVPEARKQEVQLVAHRLNLAIGGYFRGQLLVAGIVGTMASIGLAIIDLPFWLVVGMVAGIFNMIPMVGPYLGAVPGVVVALTTGDPTKALWVIVVMVVVQQIDNHFISPVVMQRAVRLHPAVVMLTLLAGGTLGGFFGLLLAVPTVAVLKVLVGHLWRTYVLQQPIEVEALAFAAMDTQPGVGPVEKVEQRSEPLDRIAYPVDSDTVPEPEPDAPDDAATTESGDDPENSATDSADDDEPSAD